MRARLPLSLLLLSLASTALAQTHFCIAGDLDRLDANQVAACKTKMTNVREAVRRRGAPAGWHFVVVCDEGGWSDYSTFIAPGAALKEVTFHTDRSEHLTFVRGSRVDLDSTESADMLLAVAMRGVPTPKVAPMPNPKRVLHDSELSVASVEAPKLP